MKTKFLFLLLLVSGLVRAQVPVLVTPHWLNEHKNDPNLVIVQVSFLQAAYDREHIPNARFLWPIWLAPNSPQSSANTPDIKEAQKIFQQFGISNNSQVVVVYNSGNEVSLSARMFLTFEHFGLKGQVSFLDGGFPAWKKEGFTVTTEKPTVKSGNFKAKTKTLLVDKDYVLKSRQSPANVVVDARAKNVYDGDPVGYLRNGHIAGAKNIFFMEMIDQQSNMFKPADSLKTYFEPVVPDNKSEVITYCFVGQTASVVYLAGRILGYDIKLYDGSMQEWSYLENLPMEETKK
jgi:thiosulfate/3-mercaptopyruvate sulfurtransferase